MMHPKSFKKLVIDNAVGILWSQWVNLGAWSRAEQTMKCFSDRRALLPFQVISANTKSVYRRSPWTGA